MQPIQLFKIASQQAQWLAVRQTVVAGNIANVNTQGYAAKDVESFKAVLDSSSKMAATNPAHFSSDGVRGKIRSNEINGIAVNPSGNNVNLANEISKGSGIKRAYEINTGIVKTMNRMMMATLGK
jgi:flagellar basal-body rod protein FlgB